MTEFDQVGPSPPPLKRAKVLEHEHLFTQELPNTDQYETSLMHRDVVNYCFVTKTDFLITTSIDGHVKFWKKVEKGVEFVKHFRAHLGLICTADVTFDGRSFASSSVDKFIKVFDVITFDMINMIKLDYLPNSVCWVNRPSKALTLLACSEKDSGKVNLYDGRGGADLLFSISIHSAPVHIIRYNPIANVTVSIDERGMMEYWSPNEDSDKGYGEPNPEFVSWKYKSDTDLYEFKKNRIRPSCFQFSPDFQKFVTFEFKDRQYRLFNFRTGKITKKIDESLDVITKNQEDPDFPYRLEEMEFGRRLAIEKEIEKSQVGQSMTCNAVFDETGNFLIFPSISGIKILNLHTNKIAVLLGKDETIRFMNIALYQGAPRRKAIVTEMAASENTVIKESEETDPTLFCTAYKKNRFYAFSRREPDSSSTAMSRDIYNEKPTRDDQKSAAPVVKEVVGQSCIIHTTFGDIYLRLFPEIAPKAVENFIGLAEEDYYNNTIWHRCIKGFMIQGGDPEGDGTGGRSLWNKAFEDEFHPNLRHDRPYTVSMANSGPNTNGSQFFITVSPAPWLDDKHTIFGRCTGGMDVIHRIEHAKVDKHDRPIEPIRIISIEMRE